MSVRAPAKNRIVVELREKIVRGDYPSDAPLREAELAEQFGVSRTPIREALRQLESEGLVRSVPNAGVFVGRLSWDDASEIFSVRIVLEAFAAQLTTATVTTELVRALHQILEQQGRFVLENDVTAYMRSDEEFHALINNACGNQHLIRLIESHNDKTKLFTLRDRSFHRERGLETSLKEHTNITQVIEAGDTERIGLLVYQHGARFFSNVVRNQIPGAALFGQINEDAG